MTLEQETLRKMYAKKYIAFRRFQDLFIRQGPIIFIRRNIFEELKQLDYNDFIIVSNTSSSGESPIA